jgi:UDP-N-acetylmuramoylalanine--D-glutamate ligase
MKLLEGKSVSIIGLGASGMAASRLALTHGGEVYVSDSNVEPTAAAGAAELRSLGARVELGGHDLERMARADTVVVSPGIPPDAPVLKALRANGCRWVSEPEFAFRFLKGPLIAVTGTNGKTTTAAMTARLFEKDGLVAGLGGNIGSDFGPPASGLALADPAPDWFVVEVSSFQLADMVDFSPSIGVVTNLAPDHLDRYPTLDDYYSDKARLFQNATPESTWVLNGDLSEVEELAGDAPGRRFRFSSQGAEDSNAYLQDGELFLRLPDEDGESVLAVRELGVLGRHNASNALAAALTARLAGVSTSAIAAGLKEFRPLPHRMELVGDRQGRSWVNDSKATNVAATSGALQSLEGPLVLLLGGKDKGEDLEPLKQAIHPGVRFVVLFGEARLRMAATLDGSVPLQVVDGSFEDAVNTALKLSLPGDLLLLSPACSSFDMFRNYVERGLRFCDFARGDA